MMEKMFIINNRHGLHARPAAQLVKIASRYKCDIRLSKEEIEINAKSIMGVMMLAAEVGSEITVRAEGEDEEQAIEALGDLIENSFGED